MLGGWLEKTRQHPGWPVKAGLGVLRAHIDLRSCQRLGARPRLYGRCAVANHGHISIGDRLLMHGATVRCELATHEGGRIEIGDRAFVNYGTSISAHRLVRIGDGCLIGQYTIIMDCDQHSPGGEDGHGTPEPVLIGDRVWIGARCTILKGVTIGSDSVLAAGSVVTQNVPPGCVVGGVPARLLKKSR
jgi:acetyltransferase-like isoleucine patch superfamily enzyme